MKKLNLKIVSLLLLLCETNKKKYWLFALAFMFPLMTWAQCTFNVNTYPASGPGCNDGSAAYTVTWQAGGAGIYYYTITHGNGVTIGPYYNMSGCGSYCRYGSVGAVPGNYTITFQPEGCSYNFTIVSAGGSATMSSAISLQQNPSSRCTSNGIIDITYSYNIYTCYTTPVATLTHANGTMSGTFISPNKFRFANVPNSKLINIKIINSDSIQTTQTINDFFGPCETSHNLTGITDAPVGCYGTITGTKNTIACGPVNFYLLSVATGTTIISTFNGPNNFTANVPPGNYQIISSSPTLGTTDTCSLVSMVTVNSLAPVNAGPDQSICWSYVNPILLTHITQNI